MNCPYCSSKTKVTNSRSRAKETQTWRRRQCTKCNSIWTTHEVIDPSSSHRIRTPDNTLAPFSRDILFLSIKDSLQHRKTAIADATALTDTVLHQILTLESAIIDYEKMISIVLDALSNFDLTAAAVYKATHK